MQGIFERRSEYQLNDSAQYYFEQMDTIAAAGYIPTEQVIELERKGCKPHASPARVRCSEWLCGWVSLLLLHAVKWSLWFWSGVGVGVWLHNRGPALHTFASLFYSCASCATANC